MVDHDGALVAMSNRLRTVDDRLRIVIEQRDGGCRVPPSLGERVDWRWFDAA